jgi:hypothetical protein
MRDNDDTVVQQVVIDLGFMSDFLHVIARHLHAIDIDHGILAEYSTICALLRYRE